MAGCYLVKVALLLVRTLSDSKEVIGMSIMTANLVRHDLPNPAANNAAALLSPIDASFLYFQERPIETSGDFEQTFRLRYEVYCEEMGFLPPGDYPDGLETDSHDGQSLHFGSFNTDEAIVGTVRLVRGNGIGEMPMDQHCELFPDERRRLSAMPNIVEVSRLAVSRNYRRRAGDGQYGLSGLPGASDPSMPAPPQDRRRVAYPTVLRLYRVMYHTLKRNGTVDILASMEVTLYRVLRALRFPFREIGPDRKSTRLNSSHFQVSRMPSSA